MEEKDDCCVKSKRQTSKNVKHTVLESRVSRVDGNILIMK